MLKVKKLLPLIVALALILSSMVTLVGCGKTEGNSNTTAVSGTSDVHAQSDSEATTAKKLEPITFKWYGGAYGADISKIIETSDVWQKIKSDTGITLEMETIEMTPDFSGKLNVMIAGGDLPDFIECGAVDAASVIKAKAGLALDELLEKYGQNFVKNFPDFIKMTRKNSPDGKIYNIATALNGVNPVTAPFYNAWWVRWDLYAKLGYPKVENLDGFQQLTKDMLALEPTNKDGKKNYGLGQFFADTWGSIVLDNPEHFIRGFSHNTIAYFDMNRKFAGERLTDPNSIFWEMAKFYNKAYRQGLLDPESATMKYGDFSGKATTGRYMAGGPGWLQADAHTQFTTDGQPEKGHMPIIIGDWENYKGKNWIHLQKNLQGHNMLFVTKACKDPERAMQFLDYLSTPEALTLWCDGVEGKQWDYVDGVPTIRDDVLKKKAEDAEYKKQVGYGSFPIVFGDQNIKRTDGYPAELMSIPVNSKKEVKDQLTQAYCDYFKVDYANQKWVETLGNLTQTGIEPTLPANSEESTIMQKISTYVEATIGKIVFQQSDGKFDEEKAKFIEKVKELGSDKVIAKLKEVQDKLAQ